MERISAVADTGFVVALLNRADTAHESVKSVYVGLKGNVLLPQTVLVEVSYLIGRDAGIDIVVTFLRGLPRSRFRLTALTDQDVKRVAEILEQYRDSRIDFVDATVMAVAERVMCGTILTLDQRDFRVFRPRHMEYFDLLPMDR